MRKLERGICKILLNYESVKKIYLLHPEKLAKWPQVPFHFAGGGPNPSPLKLLDSGVIPGNLNTRLYTTQVYVCVCVCV